MRVRMFKPQFAPLVEAGNKRQTIRPWPKRMPKTGDVESWREWTGKPYRSKQRELAQVKLMEVSPITLTRDGCMVGGIALSALGEAKLAADDGFKSFRQMQDWFDLTHGLPFNGVLVAGEDFKP